MLVGLTVLGITSSLRADDPPSVAPAEKFSDEQKSRWAFQPPTRPELPDVKEGDWVRNPIDRFILAGLEEVEFRHAAEAEKIALIRRLTFDLTGLPPTPADVRAFVADPRPDAYDRLVDRLLDSPAYGERWAQHWLDLAHYADSNGFELDAERPDAWRYRDWVVQALNDDLPFDRFVSLQLAGDEVAPGDPSALIATGFGRCGPREVVGGNADPVVVRQSELTEITGTVGSVFLGLTFGCARCHDHKFDPLPTTDYYRLQSFFAATALEDVPIASEGDQKTYENARNAVNALAAPIRKRMAAIEAPYRKEIRERKQAMLSPAERAVLATPPAQRTFAQKRLAEGIEMTADGQVGRCRRGCLKKPADHSEREHRKQRSERDPVQDAPPACTCLRTY